MTHKIILKQLRKISKYKKKERCELIYKVHKKHGISKKTLFYLKEYGPNKNATKTILKESIKILLLASIISSLGGFAVENIKTVFISIIPLVILLPALNDMIGDYGTIVSSKFSGMLHLGKIRKSVFSNKDIRKLFLQIIIIAVLLALLSSGIAIAISTFSAPVALETIYKIFLITVIDVVLLIIILFTVAIIAGLYFYKRKEDPNNFLIPITTSIADFGNMAILAFLVIMLF